MSKCVYPSCEKNIAHKHHIIYKPPVIEGLCRKHHEDITICNINASRKIRRKLSNKHRWYIWYGWLKGEIVPERTPEALKWIGRWDSWGKRPKRKRGKIAKGKKVWTCRAERMTEKMFNGLTHGEARTITDNARLYLLSQLYEKDVYDEALDLAVLILNDANHATGIRGEMAKFCKRNLEEAWPYWKLEDVKYPFYFGASTWEERFGQEA